MQGLIAIPIYNEAGSLGDVIENLTSRFPKENLFFIDDGSVDKSRKILDKFGVPYIRHSMNLGYEETLRTALQEVLLKDYPFVVFFDSDGQHRVEDLEKGVQIYPS